MSNTPYMSQLERRARWERMRADAAKDVPLDQIAKDTGLTPNYVGRVCSGEAGLTPYKNQTVKLACQIIRLRQLGKSYREIYNGLGISHGYVWQVVKIAEKEGVLT